MKTIIASTLNRNCGVGQYTEQLAKSLQSKVDTLKVLRKDDPDNQLFFTYPYRSFRNLQHHVAPYFLSRALKKLEADIWHADLLGAFHAMELAGIKQPKVVSVHDAIPFHFPGKKLDFRIYKYQLRKAMRNAKSLIVVSETAKKDLIAMTGIAPHKVAAIPNGLPLDQLKTFSKNNEVFTIRYLGGLGAPHKNVQLLLHAAKLLEDKGLSFSLELGGYAPEQFFLRDLAKELDLKSVKFIGFVPDEDKSRFLGEADLFAYPSLMEGFGFPPMEAMGCGTAALASDIPVFQELLRDAAVLQEPTPEAFAASIQNLMDNPDRLRELERKGLEKVQEYTWEKAAQKTLEVYRQALR